MIPGIELAACGPLAVPHEVMEHVIRVESSRNPFAIGVVGGRLLRQPRSLAEAAATVRMLEANGHNYSIGLAQVNRVNFARFGLDTPEQGFEVCNNLSAGAKILAECLQRHGGRWGDAFSCYYSGNARTGYEHGYVQKVFGAMADARAEPPIADAIPLAPPAVEAVQRETNADRTDAWSAVYAARISAPPAIGAAQRETNADRTDAWSAVYAARISAPEARRAEPLARAEPVEAGVGFVSIPASSQSLGASGPNPSAPVAAASTARGTPTPRRLVAETRGLGLGAPPPTPEAQLVLEMQQRLGAAEAPSAGRGSSVAPAATDGPFETAVDNQQPSNSQVEDAARVF